MAEFDFVSIGDITTDAFIHIDHASVNYNKAKREEELCLTNGAKIPFEFVKVVPAVGNSSNAAVSAARLGLNTAFVSNLGDDDHGHEDLEILKGEKVDTRFIKVHPDLSSNYHYVLWHKAERTILIKHEAYPYEMPDVGNPKWMYFSSVGEDSIQFHHDVAAYAKSHPETKLAFQPGTFQIELGAEKLKDLYEASEVFFCNVEEARLIIGDEKQEVPKKELTIKIHELGPKIVVVTDGAEGLYAYEGDNQGIWFIPPYPDPKPPYDRTGAGDACESTITAALALGLSMKEAIMWGPINSMSVVQYVGAREGLLTREKLEEYLANAPEDYQPRKV
ncbi:MAG TPA: carbohydrate kinase family protein [Candidatus Paceibacterota bacterium]|nr:carbohydrate kinase family protein [Candidatus Paceibacterota bacterium]